MKGKALILLAMTCFLTILAFAPEASASVNDALSRAGINPNGDFEDSGVFEDLNKFVYFIMAIGGFWIIICLIWGGMTLAGSGGNPQKRTEGFMKLALVAVGAFIIIKAYDIAGWVAGLGTAFIQF
ncbi:hypothetical protein ACFVAD_18950 [Sutcliffiella sp. NPDC057660]|uniref:hypothetical protein n=1 Tax=Sutcliffiella sp. NPDC057660 TaxID=3346199 RepID=UPI0036A4D6A1